MARVIFDLDGTLVDSAPSITAAANRVLARLGRPPVSVPTVTRFVGQGMAALVERLLRHTGGVPPEGVAPHLARYRAIYGSDPVAGTATFPGVPAALAELAAAGHGLAVCTQKPAEPARRLLEGLGLMPMIGGLTGGDSVGALKPDPRLLRHAAAQLPPGPVIYVGDGETDAETAQNARVPFLLHTCGYRRRPITAIPHTAAFDDFTLLPGLVEALLRERVAP
jgi:phosphoglycolate phosphatase